MTAILLLAASQACSTNRYKKKFTSASRVGELQLYYTDANAAVLLQTVLMVQTRTFAVHVEGMICLWQSPV
jgi:ABC-type uncharacterized transport system permease subunit